MKEWKPLPSPNGYLATLECSSEVFASAVHLVADRHGGAALAVPSDQWKQFLRTTEMCVRTNSEIIFRVGKAACRVYTGVRSVGVRHEPTGKFTTQGSCTCDGHNLLFAGMRAYREVLRRNRRLGDLMDRATSSWVAAADRSSNRHHLQDAQSPRFRIGCVLGAPSSYGGWMLRLIVCDDSVTDGNQAGYGLSVRNYAQLGPSYVEQNKDSFYPHDVALHYMFKPRYGNSSEYQHFMADSQEGEFALSYALDHCLLLDTELKPIGRGADATARFHWVPGDDGTKQILDCHCVDANDVVGELIFLRRNAWFFSVHPKRLFRLSDASGGIAFARRVPPISHREASLSAEAAERLATLGIPLPHNVLDAPSVDAHSSVIVSVDADGEQLIGAVAVVVNGESVDLLDPDGPRWRTADGAEVVSTSKGLARLSPLNRQHSPTSIAAELLKRGVRVVPVEELAASRDAFRGQAAAKLSNKVEVLKRFLPPSMPVSALGLHDADLRFDDGSAVRLSMLPDGSDAFWSIGVALDVGGTLVELPDLVESLVSDQAFMELMRSANGDVPWSIALADGRRIQMPVRTFAELLRPVIEWVESFSSRKQSRMTRLQAAVLAESLGLHSAQPLASMRCALRAVMDAASNPLEAVPPGFKGELRHYQQIGVHWLNSLAAGGFGGVLADDMGLGKTVQVIAHIAAQRSATPDAPPCLIVAPKTVLLNWKPEFERFAPGLKVLLLDGFSRDAHFEQIPVHDVVLTHYALLPRDRESLQKHRFSLVVLDEAQMVKNPATLAAETLRSLDAARFLPVTGTPLENHMSELWTHLSLAVPSLMPELKQFRSIYEAPITRDGNPERLANLKRLIAPFILRRTKDQVATELPPKTETIDWVELPDSTRRLYEVMRAAQRASALDAIRSMTASQAQVFILTALMRLRQVCCDARLCAEALPPGRSLPSETPKLDALVLLLQKAIEDGRKILVFSSFAEMVRLIADRLAYEGIRYASMTGQTRDRGPVLDSFRFGAADVLVMTTQTGGVGLNLTEADTVVHYDPWWNPAREAQATDRAHRIGQHKPVFVHKLVCSQTIEDRILSAQHAKSQLAHSLLDEGTTIADEHKLTALIDLLDDEGC